MASFNLNELTKVKAQCPATGKNLNAIMIATLDDNKRNLWFVKDNGTYIKSILCPICGQSHEAAKIRTLKRK
jgi:hypothetical protein